MLKKLSIILLILASLGAGAFFVISRLPKIQIVTPIFKGPDQTDKISKKLSSQVLDYTNSEEIPSLAKVPRYLVYDNKTKEVLFAKGEKDKMSPASFTKLLSSMVVLDLIPETDTVTVQAKSVFKVPTVLGLKEGEKFTVSELLRGAIATSANDAAQVLADNAAEKSSIYPSEFIYYMNKKATLLDMKYSHFANPDGLDEQNQYSTLDDIAKLVNNVQTNYPSILEAAKSDNRDIATSSAHGYYYLPNWNGLLGVYPGVNGLKIAYTEKAGYSTIVTATRSDYSIVALVSGTDSYLERDRAAADLLDSAFMTKKLSPVRISTNKLNQRYKIWGDLARTIKNELKSKETGN